MFNRLIAKRTFSAFNNYSHSSNSRVWLSIAAGEKDLGKIEFELFENQVPKTTANFKALCTGENDSDLSYKGAEFSTI